MPQRQVIQLVDGDDVVQMLQVPLLVSHEVRDSGAREDGQVAQLVHVLVGHLPQRAKFTRMTRLFSVSSQVHEDRRPVGV